MAGQNHQDGQTVASKLVRVLAVFTADRPRLRAAEICRRSGLPFSTVHRILAELASYGVLQRAPDGTYAVGVRLWELAASHPQVRLLRAAATRAMWRLHTALDTSVYLHVQVGTEGLCVEELSSDRDGPPAYRYGTRFQLQAAAGGHVLLAYAEMKMLQQSLAGPAPEPDAEPGVSPRRLERLLKIRRAGVVVTVSDTHLGVAAPVFDPSGAAMASLEAVTPLPADRNGLVLAVRSAGSEVSTAVREMRNGCAAGPTSNGHLSGRHPTTNGHPSGSSRIPTQWEP